MLVSLWPLLLFFALSVGVMVVLVRRSGQQRQQTEDSMRSAASAQGWSFDSQDSGPMTVMRWQGTTEGTRWTLEYRRSRSTRRTRHAHTHRAVWWADTFRGPASPVLFIGVQTGQENPFMKLEGNEGMLATMAQKAAGFALDKALDVHFGEEAGRQVDARLLKPVQAAGLTGFMVMAADEQQAMWMLGEGGPMWLDALASEAPGQGNHRPWVLALPRRVLLARSTPIRTEDDVRAMVREGLSLVATLT